MKKQEDVTHSQGKRKSVEATPGKTQMLKSATSNFKAVIILCSRIKRKYAHNE